MLSTMMDFPLSIQMILRHGARIHGDSRVGTFDGAKFTSTRFAEVAQRAERLAAALASLDVRRGARVATYCWNHQSHLEAYLAVPSMGAVLHTLNIRLFPEQVAGVMDHARDDVLIIDGALLPQIVGVLPGIRSRTARSSGIGIFTSGIEAIGIVLHLFDHIDSGAFAPVGPRV